MSDEPAQARANAHDSLATWLFGLVGLGDMGVGALVLAYPPLLGWLIGRTLDPGGEIAARLLGCAALALGSGWWLARHQPTARGALLAGLLVYNVGAGVVFLSAALLAAAPVVPGLIALLHLGIGVVAVRVGTKVQ